ncbi:transmembrane protein 59 isoform X2 [Chiloscyllium plagiosum]|uniref:transmembrane protein 59 isoform X2 n=1 Tax=Chiloscyllium plagiosum TaxID=36176 RepID=UPI001CB81E55|nr:transmembrane protein 59 isoform X2 [Chiloscyllium plagiosum]
MAEVAGGVVCRAPALSFLLYLGIALCFFSTLSLASDAFEAVLGDTASCQKSCEMTYSLHTYPKEEELYACQRGCRLFSICQFVDEGTDLNKTKNECESACAEAYKQQGEQFACNLGCENQLPFAEQRQKQSEPDVQFMVPQFELQTENSKETSQALSDHIAKAIYDDTRKTFRKEHGTGLYMKEGHEQEYQSVLECLSRNAGIPRWILTTTLVLSVLVLLWICCATAATAVEQHIPSEKLSIYGDMEFMNELKLTPYPASSLIVIKSKDEKDMAGPIPTKVNLDHSTI